MLVQVATVYREDRWWHLLSTVLEMALRCAERVCSFKDYVEIALECIGSSCLLEDASKQRIQTNLLRLLAVCCGCVA